MEKHNNYGRSSTYHQIPFPEFTPSTNENIVREWLGQISKVDTSMTSLANALDTMHASAGVLTGYSNDQSSREDETGKMHASNYTDDQRLARKLLLTIERTVLHNKRFAMRSLQEFLHIVISSFGKYSGKSTESFERLSLDAYLEQPHDQECCQLISDKKLEKLEMENSRLKEEKVTLAAQIEVLIEKEDGYIKEIDVLKQKSKTLEEYKTNLVMQKNKCENSISELNKDVSKLQQRVNDSERATESTKNINNEYQAMTVKYKTLQKELEDVKVVEVKYKKKKTELKTLKIHEDEYEKLQNQLKDFQIENDLLNDGIAKRDAEITTNKSATEMRVEMLQLDIDTLTNENSKKDEMIASLELTAAERNKKLHQVQSENCQLSTDYAKIKGNYEAEIKKNRKQTDEMTATINELKTQMEGQQSTLLEMEILRQRCQTHEETILANKQVLQTKDRDEQLLKFKLQKHNALENENTNIKHKTTQLQNEIEKLKMSNNSLQEMIQTGRKLQEQVSRKNKDLAMEVAETCQEKLSLQADIERFSETIRSLTSKNAGLEEDISILNHELEMYKSKKIIQVQLYYQRRGDLMSAVEEELTCLLKSKLEYKDNLEVEFIKCVSATDVNPDIPLLLLCISASRIGTDAANTIHGLQLTSKMSMLIFHHKDEHALPNQASHQVLTGPEYKRLGGIFDFGFLSGKGIYTCSLNDSSIAKMVSFINTEGVAKSV